MNNATAQCGPTRRSLLGAAVAGVALAAGAAGAAAAAPDRREWESFRARFVLPDGRIVDTGNHGISHTEGQGWGLLFAVTFDDERSFDLILDWTAKHLRRPHDALHAWKFDPAAKDPVGDRNNATDGDLFIALALARAARRWGRPDHHVGAAAIAQDILRLLVRVSGGRTLLLPGVQGFETKDAVVVNPSYYAFPALGEVALLAESPLWASVQRDGLALINEGRFGRWMLPPDWLRVAAKDGSLKPAGGWPPRFSYDAVRVPLYLSWARMTPPPVAEAFTAYWSQHLPVPPAWIDLDDGSVSPYPAPPGMLAVRQLAAGAPAAADFPTVMAAPDYYSAALTLLARIAWSESRPAI
jgi:endoglucanase